MTALVDSSGLLAVIDVDDARHREVIAYVDTSDDLLLVPVTVLPEVDYLVTKRFGVQIELRVLRAVAGGEFRMVALSEDDLWRSLELIEQYADSNIGLVDASIVAIAERLRITRVLTLDHRHFRMFRPKHCAAFDLVP